MIMVRIEMWPQGDPNKKRDLAAITIANVGGDARIADYEYQISHQIDSEYGGAWVDHRAFAFEGRGVWKRGNVRGFVRARGAVALLTHVLKAAFFRAGAA